ncbi:hypothetical protein D4764_0188270 [Takifugu flavidus]|uniref:Reverse transcriptase domain-containing protein n=1 Tax=Takifugu flavidus TaxID=433684 RepID=A0A5C6MLK4_9TELE|nr:hypothetical protein D4764_0188270 [Takifugu flavidus]
MKSLECLILPHLKSITTPPPGSTAHLDSPGTYARILFVDFSSAFNTIRPALLQDNCPSLVCLPPSAGGSLTS